MSVGGNKSKSSSKIKIPKFLRGLYRDAADMGQGALSNIQGLTDPNNQFIAEFDPAENLSHMLGINRALDPNSNFNTAMSTLTGAAEGTDISSFLPEASMDALNSIAGGVDVTSGIPDIREMMTPGVGSEQLERVASGEYLYGGDGFNAALDAAMNRILPQVRTQFGRTGAGGGTGSLAAEAVGDRLGEQFALQYGQERGRQDAAAGLLENLGITRAGTAADFDLGKAGLDLEGTGLQKSAADMLASLGDAERQRGVTAASMIPGLANMDLDMLGDIGRDRRGLEQAKLDAPLSRQMEFLNAIFGVNAFGSPTGQSSKNKGIGFGYTAK